MAQGVRDLGRRLIAALGIAAGLAAQPGERPPHELVDAVLQKHHGPLRGTFDSAVIQLRAQPDDPATQVLLQMPGRMRVDHPGDRVDLLVDGNGWRCVRGSAAERLEGEALQDLQTLMMQVRGLLLLPLYRAEKIKRVGPGILSLMLPGGETWRLELDPETLTLKEVRGPGGAVRFDAFLTTRVTVHPQRVALGERGTRHVKFVTSDLFVADSVFADPFGAVDLNAAKPRRRALHAPRASSEMPARAELQELPRRTYLVLADPGDWDARCRAIVAAGQLLGDAGQLPDGLPTYRLTAGERRLLIPFRADPSKGSPPFVRSEGQVIEHQPAQQAVVVAPARGPWRETIASGEKMIAAFAAARGYRAAGPLVAIPFIEPVVPPDAALRGKLPIRLELPVRAKSRRDDK